MAPADTAPRVRPRGSLGTLNVQNTKICCGFCRIDYRTTERWQYSGYLLCDLGVSSLVILWWWWLWGDFQVVGPPTGCLRLCIYILQEVGGRCGDWMELAQDRVRWRAHVCTVRNLRVPKMRGISWLAAEPVSFSRRTLLHVVRIYIYIFIMCSRHFPGRPLSLEIFTRKIKAIQPFKSFCNYLPVDMVSASQQTWISSSTAVRTPNLALTLSVTRSITRNTEWAKGEALWC